MSDIDLDLNRSGRSSIIRKLVIVVMLALLLILGTGFVLTNNEVGAYRTEVIVLNHNLSSENKTLSADSAQLAADSVKITSMNNTIGVLHNQINLLSKTNTNLTIWNDNLSGELVNLTSVFNKLNTTNFAQFQSLTSDVNQLTNQIASLTSEVSSLTSQTQTLSKLVVSLEGIAHFTGDVNASAPVSGTVSIASNTQTQVASFNSKYVGYALVSLSNDTISAVVSITLNSAVSGITTLTYTGNSVTSPFIVPITAGSVSIDLRNSGANTTSVNYSIIFYN